MVRVDPRRRACSQPDQRTLFQVGENALLDALGFAKIGIVGCLCHRLYKLHLKCHLRYRLRFEWSAEEPGKSQPCCALPPAHSNQPLAMSGTLPAGRINWQCTPSQLEVKLKSTGNSLTT